MTNVHITSFLLEPADEFTDDTLESLVTAMVKDRWSATRDDAHEAIEAITTSLPAGEMKLRDIVCHVGRHLDLDVTDLDSLVLMVQ